MAKKIDFKHEERAIIIAYLKAKENKAIADKAEKTAKAACKELLTQLGKAFKSTAKTDYVYGMVQVNGKAKPFVYKETTANGAIDWEAYARSLGGTDEGAESYRKAGNVRTVLDWATTKQTAEIEKM